jgi:HK97 gp10 family phage protein
MRMTIEPKGDLDLSGLDKEVVAQVHIAVLAGATIIANDAKRAIASGPKTGKTYTRRGVEHQASAPGEAPATDTGGLIGSIVADAEIVSPTEVVGYVEARSEHAVHLEYGTRKMAARPFLNPARERNEQRVQGFIRAALTTASALFARKR